MSARVAGLIYIFYLIEEDDLALNIAQRLVESKGFTGECKVIVCRYEKEILERYILAKNSGSSSKYSRLFVSMMKYINDNE